MERVLQGTITTHLTTIANKVVVLELRSSYEVHTYQFSTSYLQDCDLTYNRSQIGAFLPPGTLPGGEVGRGVKFPRSTSYDKHTYQF